MNIFLIGYTASGKTTLGMLLCGDVRPWGAPIYIKASEWIRRQFAGSATAEVLTEASRSQLRDNPRVCLDYIRRRNDISKPGAVYVIDGVRNPGDFAGLFDPRTDLVVFVYRDQRGAVTTFEGGGVAAIAAHVGWMVAEAILSPSAVLAFTVGDAVAGTPPLEPHPNTLPVRSFDEVVAHVVGHSRMREPAPSMRAAPVDARVHVEVPPIRGWVAAEFLYNGNPERVGQFVEATAFAVSSYPGDAPTWKVLLADGSSWDYIPPHAFTTVPARARLSMADLAHANCPAAEVCVQRFDALAGPVHVCFLKGRAEPLWRRGRYLFTIDWFTKNESANVVEVEGGEIAFVPNHKLLFGGQEGLLPAYQKMRATWRVEDA